MVFDIILSCEHAGKEIPSGYKHLFNLNKVIQFRHDQDKLGKLLDSHWGWDPGALELSRRLQKKLKVDLHSVHITRMLADTNRSSWNPNVLTVIAKELSVNDKRRLVNKFYYPHLRKVEGEIRDRINKGNKVLHISVHTFTPFWKGNERKVDFGILYHLKTPEVQMARMLKKELAKELPWFRIRFNQPYVGYTDDLLTGLRKVFPSDQYFGLMLELNNKYYTLESEKKREVEDGIVNAIESFLSKLKL